MSTATGGAARGTGEWSAAESVVLSRAVHHAPSVHNIRPWSLTLHDRAAELRERPTVLVQHDPDGRDRRISCGTAVANLVLAIRGLGRTAEVVLSSSAGLVVATATSTGRAEPTEAERRRGAAVLERESYRKPFADAEVPEQVRDALLEAVVDGGATGRWITGADESLGVAQLLCYAARVFHDNPDYQRELHSWTTAAGGSLRWDALGERGLAAVGLTTSRTRLPDEAVLASRIAQEAVLVVGTRADQPLDQVRAGTAVQQAWLEATSRGLVASVSTQPLHLVEVRNGLAHGLGFAAAPQILVRFGYPAERR
ncbi:hypothetical protein [Saccharopolyspora hordei]|uniref:Nitroreductase n=1 Tax=Saccharopolyspora hordei TaxID=1838 RepID=A0A853AIG4_9PSEU|nr:hypothetical protein [Saccharopolyspora hordei]NYI84422.1 nitroreductase [Saccharopolyspora hordei]